MRIVSWNVNGLRACERKGFGDWLARTRPDVLALQEVRALPAQLSDACQSPEGYAAHFHPAERPGYSGVALWSRTRPTAVTYGLDEADPEGRVLIASLPGLTLYNLYVPNGGRDHGRVPFKLAFLARLIAHLAPRMRANEPIALVGDFNVAREPIDLANPRANVKYTGFLPEERAMLERLIALGFRDPFRERHPGEKGHYTMWNNRPGVREKNVGWRMDYFLASERVASAVTASYHQPEVPGSDHCPVVLELDPARLS